MIRQCVASQAPDVAVRALLQHGAQELLVGRSKDERELVAGEVVLAEQVERLSLGRLILRPVGRRLGDNPDECIDRDEILGYFLASAMKRG